MTRPDDLKTLRRSLEKRLRDLNTARDGAQSELNSLKEAGRYPEYEETAQAASAEYTLVTVIEAHRKEIEQVQAALESLHGATFGICIDCDTEIPFDRLQAVPHSRRCADCATATEANSSGAQHAMPSL